MGRIGPEGNRREVAGPRRPDGPHGWQAPEPAARRLLKVFLGQPWPERPMTKTAEKQWNGPDGPW
jgi:hypothetical protein